MTKREYFAQIRNIVADNKELVDFIDHEVELLNKKSSSPRKPSARQVENVALKKDVLATLARLGEPVTIGQIVAETPSLEGLSNQRVTHLLTDLRKDGEVERTYVKKVAHFAVVGE
jgi:hypothetical protein